MEETKINIIETEVTYCGHCLGSGEGGYGNDCPYCEGTGVSN